MKLSLSERPISPLIRHTATDGRVVYYPFVLATTTKPPLNRNPR